MANPVVRVILSAVDEVTGTAKKAGDALDGFGGKVASLYKAAAALVAGSVLAKFFDDSIKEAAAAEVQMGRLGTAVANAGGDFNKLRGPLEDTVKAVQRVSTATDDDLREALTRMIAVSGDVSGSMNNLALVADLAAYKNIGLSEAADIVGKAMNGNTTALNKMGIAGKDATTVIGQARAAFGGFAANEAASFSGRLTQIGNQWGEFKEAVGVAILSTGEAGGAATGLANVLANLASWVEKNEAAIGLTVSAIGRFLGALFDVGKAVYEVVQPALGPVVKVLFGTLLTLLESASFGVRFLGAAFKGLAGDTLAALGTVVQKGGGLLKLFGVQVVAETGASLRTFGEQLSASARQNVSTATETWKVGMRDLLTGASSAHAEQRDEEVRHQTAVTRIHEDGHKARLTKAQIAQQVNEELLKQANAIYERTSKALQEKSIPVIQDIGETWVRVSERVGGVAKRIDVAKVSQDALAEATDLVAKREKDVLTGAEKARLKFLEQVDGVQAMGQGLIGAAQGMGLLSDRAASSLTSVLNMGTAIAKFGIGSPEGILSIVGGLANLIGSWGSSPAELARKAAMARNTQAIDDLRASFDEYNLGVSGRSFGGILDVLTKLDIEGPTKGNIQTEGVKFLLKQAGISFEDAKKLADRYGIDIEAPGGWNALLAIMRTRKFGSPEGNFTDELASIESSFDVLGVEDEDDKLAAFAAFVDKHIPALRGVLDDLHTPAARAAAAATLKDLYRDSISGKLAPADYGGASPQQFRQIVATLLPLLGSADGVLGGVPPVSGPTPAPTPAPSGGLGTPGGTSGLAAPPVGGLSGLGVIGVPGNLGGLGQIPTVPALSLASGRALPAASILVERAQFGPFEFPNVRSAADAEDLYAAIMERAQRELSRIRDAQGNAERT